MSEPTVASPVASLRPTPDEVNTLAERAEQSSKRELLEDKEVNQLRARAAQLPDWSKTGGSTSS